MRTGPGTGMEGQQSKQVHGEFEMRGTQTFASRNVTFAVKLLAGTALGLVAMAGSAVAAQTVPPAADQAPAVVAEPAPEPVDEQAIVVTGSRAAGAGFIAPTPTTVLGVQAIEQRQSTNIAQILNEQPAFKATTSPAANAIRTQQPGASTADLRGLGAARTLVLVNGARVPPLAPANYTGAVVAPDLNSVPTLLVERVEVVTGGASAQWGSDAVAGVVNIRLKNRYDGIEVRAQAGISERGDAGNYRLGILAGTSFGADGRGHVVFGADYVKNNEVGDIYTRDWGANEYGRVANPGYLTNGMPATIIASNVHSATSPGGLITGPAGFALRNFEFLPGGAVAPFDLGGIRNPTLQIGGQGESLAKGVSLAPGVERFNPYMRVEYEVSDALRLHLEGSYGISIGTLTGLPPRDGAITIRRDNAFLPDAVRTAMGALPSFTMSRISYDIGPSIVRVKNRTPRIAAGGEGDLGGTWKWDAHVGWGSNFYSNDASNNRNLQRFRFASDAVNYNGQIVCRATIPGANFNAAAEGCVPINLFGSGAPSEAARGYVMGESRTRATYRQVTAAANLRGEPFSTWAGPVSFATGIEYRRESQVVTGDPIALAGGWEASNGSAFSGNFNVKEGYAEVIVPLASDMAFARKLELNGAVRVADYSSSGTQTTWKAGLLWEPLDGLRLRATRSRDLRAPAIFELFNSGSVSNLPATINNISVPIIPQNSTVGNPDLKPEIGNTLTLGAVVQPSWLPGFSASVDYYYIQLDDAITAVSGATAGTLCSAGEAYFCGLFTYNGSTPVSYRSPYINASALRTKGLDMALTYRMGLGGSNNAALTLAASGTYAFHFYNTLGTGSAPIDYAGENGPSGLPRFRSNSSLTYSDDDFSLTAQLVTISAGKIDATADLGPSTSINTNRVKAMQYLNLQSSFNVSGGFKFFMGVNNLFDRDPPPLPSATLFSLTNGIYYDTIGRSFTAGISAKF